MDMRWLANLVLFFVMDDRVLFLGVPVVVVVVVVVVPSHGLVVPPTPVDAVFVDYRIVAIYPHV